MNSTDKLNFYHSMHCKSALQKSIQNQPTNYKIYFSMYKHDVPAHTLDYG